jgi:hypothetical protein
MRLLRVRLPQARHGLGDLPEDGAVSGEPGILIYCPPSAFAMLGYSLDAALEHVCVWTLKPETDNA